ncbi:MAG TPA: NRDE family protein [Legionella sp.]|nr:NRDE family protein [Legionella sp.]
MCLSLVAVGLHPLYPLIVLSNRDEFYQRASTPAHFWPDNPGLFAGMDLVAGGTWLGVNTEGKISLVTNYRNPAFHSKNMQSRGLLVKNFLANHHFAPELYIAELTKKALQYNPFNLIFGTVNNLYHYSNITHVGTKLTSNLYGISNELLDTPWFKVQRAKQLFTQAMAKLIRHEDPNFISEMLYPVLEDKVLAPDNLLPSTGVPKEIEKSLSSIFVTIPDYEYGTRSSNIILFKQEQLFFFEKTYLDEQLINNEVTSININ